MSKLIRTRTVVLLVSPASMIAPAARPGEPLTLSQVADCWVTNIEELVVPAADATPESKYSFAPSNVNFPACAH